MLEQELQSSVVKYLVEELAYPRDALQRELPILRSGMRLDLAVVDLDKRELCAIFEFKNTRDHSGLRQSVSQVLNYWRQMGKPEIPLYLVFPASSEGKGAAYQLARILEDGSTEDICVSELPTYDALVSGHSAATKIDSKRSVKAAVDSFTVTCFALSGIALIVLWLDVSSMLVLTPKQLLIALGSIALVLLPYAARLRVLGVEFERRTSNEKQEQDL